MARSAKRRKKPARTALWHEGAAAVGGAISRNPVLVSGTTAFLVALSFVSANALWYQPHFHTGAFFATRDRGSDYVGPESGKHDEAVPDTTTIRIQREPDRAASPKPDKVVQQVQSTLRGLNLYSGTVDGIAGPNTRSAIANYRKKVGLPVSDKIDDELLTQLGVAPTTSAIGSTPAPAPRQPEAPAPRSDVPFVKKIQAGLKAFGNDDIELDGVTGTRTKDAIREFQTLFGLTVTGEPDEALYAKMREVGLTN
jgi:peptidoglycan hydrolase-like protein with peptidoglycan-binding domain